MAQHLRILRIYFLLLAIFTVGRLAMFKVPYEKGHQVFSLVTLTALSAIYFGAFARRWLGYRVSQAALLGALIGLSAQIVIFTVTLASYGLGFDNYFTNPRALLGVNAPPDPIAFGRAMGMRAGGLFANTVTATIVSCLGWAMGGLLPASAAPPPTPKK
ncbi:MAG: hypothetical protein ABW221_11180 [Vicinamibacteria bacterium]